MAARTALVRFSVDNDHFPPRFAGMLRVLSQKIDQTLIHPYHPERHYMRGPGPRWHAKHSQPTLPIQGTDG
jgi:hypothetical protein